MTASAQSEEFLRLSKKFVKRFLHTVVFVDEQAYFKTAEQVKRVTTPERRVKPKIATTETNTSTGLAHDLNAKEVMDTFASEGMICTVLKPAAGESPLGNAIEAAKRADAIILDWDIHKDNGKTALEIIRKIVGDDSKHCSRLRLILIYSGEPDIVGISEKVAECLGSDYENADGFTFTRGHLRIGIFSKEYTRVADTYKDRVIPIKQLPDLLAEEMAHITAGILSNVALEAMSILRDNTHLLLGNIGKDIDAAYLAHRALLPFPDDAMDHAVEIIASEIYSILENYQVGSVADFDAIKKWLNENNTEAGYAIRYFNEFTDRYETMSIDEEMIEDILINGFEKAREKIKYSNPDNGEQRKKKISLDTFKNLTDTFCFNGETPERIDYKFAILTSQKNYYGRPQHRPVLTLGAILKDVSPESADEKYRYWFCIQPRCDCVRIKDSRNFLFLPMKEIENDKAFNVIVKDECGNFVKLKLIDKNYESRHIEFSIGASTENFVYATLSDDGFHFESKAGKVFIWISELKSEHAQRIANNFAAKLARVGLNESEWLRRWNSGQLSEY